jgi:hypothetical protein
MDSTPAGFGKFTPDKAGRYLIEGRDVIETHPLASYAGEVVDSPGDDDEYVWDESALYEVGDKVRHEGYSYICLVEHVNVEPTEPPVAPSATNWKINKREYSGTSSYVVGDECIESGTLYRCITAIPTPHVFDPAEWTVFGHQLEFWVYEERSLQIGEVPNSASLRLRIYDQRVIDPDDDPEATVLIPNKSSKISAIAAVTSDVITVVEDIADTAAAIETILYGTINAAGSPTSFTTPAGYYSTYHLANASNWTVHGASDITNDVPSWSGVNSTLAQILAQLNAIRSEFVLHAANNGGAYHSATHVPAVAGIAYTLEEAMTLWSSLWGLINAHASNTTYHNASGSTAPADGASLVNVEAPRNLTELDAKTATLTTLYNNHRTKTTQTAAHSAADTENKLRGSITTQADLIRFANDWADSLDRHAHNLDSDGQPAASAYHQSGGSAVVDSAVKIPFRANDVASAFRLLFAVRIAYELHVTNTIVHPHAAGGNHINTTMPHLCRLAYAWQKAALVTVPPIPDNLNEAGVKMLLSLGWT